MPLFRRETRQVYGTVRIELVINCRVAGRQIAIKRYVNDPNQQSADIGRRCAQRVPDQRCALPLRRGDLSIQHVGPSFTDGKFHNIGLHSGSSVPVTDHGLREVTGAPQDEGTFRTPLLRNVMFTGP